MPEFSLIGIGLALLLAIAGGLVGWLIRGETFRHERLSSSAHWRERLDQQEMTELRLRRQIRSLSRRLQESQRRERRARRRLAALESRLVETAEFCRRTVGELQENRRRLAAANHKRDELHRQLRRLLNRVGDLMDSLRARDKKIFALSRQVGSLEERLPPLVSRFREKEKEATAAHKALDEQRARAHELEETLRMRTLGSIVEDAPADMPDGDSGSGVMATRPVGGPLVPRPADDLKRIEGVCPVLERLLNDMGVYRLEQIAGLDREDLEQLQARLGDFPGRIEQDDWVEQARRLIGERD